VEDFVHEKYGKGLFQNDLVFCFTIFVKYFDVFKINQRDSHRFFYFIIYAIHLISFKTRFLCKVIIKVLSYQSKSNNIKLLHQL